MYILSGLTLVEQEAWWKKDYHYSRLHLKQKETTDATIEIPSM